MKCKSDQKQTALSPSLFSLSLSLSHPKTDCQSGIDIVFLLDGSASLSPYQFITMKKFVINLIKKFIAKDTQVRGNRLTFICLSLFSLPSSSSVLLYSLSLHPFIPSSVFLYSLPLPLSFFILSTFTHQSYQLHSSPILTQLLYMH